MTSELNIYFLLPFFKWFQVFDQIHRRHSITAANSIIYILLLKVMEESYLWMTLHFSSTNGAMHCTCVPVKYHKKNHNTHLDWPGTLQVCTHPFGCACAHDTRWYPFCWPHMDCCVSNCAGQAFLPQLQVQRRDAVTWHSRVPGTHIILHCLQDMQQAWGLKILRNLILTRRDLRGPEVSAGSY